MSFGQGGPGWGSGGDDPRQRPQQPDPRSTGQDQGGAPWYDAPRQPGGQPLPQESSAQQPTQVQRPAATPWDSGAGTATPDWAAMAEQSAARARRRRWLMIGGGALATAVVAAVVAVAVVSTGGSDTADKPDGKLPATADIPPTDSRSPGPSFAATTPPPPPDPADFISSAKKDKAPLSPGNLFPDAKITVSDHGYTRGATADTGNCGSAAKGPLVDVLKKNDCTRLLRATYTPDKGLAVTVGVAVFDTESQARKTTQQASKGNVDSLAGHGVPGFCNTKVCRTTVNFTGRYAYFTVGGYTSGKDVTEKDADVFTATDDLGEYAFRQIRHRGEIQASQAAKEQ
ncbi:hypothetical protein [Streptomyces sp. NPDC050560]|uniref:hypothetical protein n=1 Tax=Streptomyces sp. NPDC050560 TaxID=3365630 RepID=UPI0037A07829